ncbi:FecR domain-containing protein [candidate division CSSED10-310 bacterium]|uniref:FecR domain-containing protein n=1 Tax=candidate division CSSED10-310 bacterium TaxID=2855610 RepID=A0ABV6Z1Z5_UNCC1
MKNNKDEQKYTLESLAAEIRDLPINAEVEQKAAARVWSHIDDQGLKKTDPGESSDRIELATRPGNVSCEDFQKMIQQHQLKDLNEVQALFLRDHLKECPRCRNFQLSLKQGVGAEEVATISRIVPHRVGFPHIVRYALAAGLLFAVVSLSWLLYLHRTIHRNDIARLVSVEGTLLDVASHGITGLSSHNQVATDEIIKTTKNSKAQLKLVDNSMLEMNERSELFITEQHKGLIINLKRGNIIVRAAPQNTKKLFVQTNDCEIAVTGTIFSVSHGIKGSRISVLEGEVHVSQKGERTILKPGQQMSTSSNISGAPIQNEVAWSNEFELYLNLLQAVSDVSEELESHPALKRNRDYSPILEILPPRTVFYVSIPNVTEYLSDFKQRLDESINSNPLLSRWWTDNLSHDFEVGFQFEKQLDKICQFGNFLQDEIVLTLSLDKAGGISGSAFISEVQDPKGFHEYLTGLIAQEGYEKFSKHICFLESEAMSDGDCSAELYVVIHEGYFAASPSKTFLATLLECIDGREPAVFQDSEFYAEILENYQNRADWMMCVDLENIVTSSLRKSLAHETEKDKTKIVTGLERLGLLDFKHFILTRGGLDEESNSKAVLTFNDVRQGMASWLEEPAPMGALNFISPEVSLFSAIVFKNTETLMQDVLEFIHHMSPPGTNSPPDAAEEDLLEMMQQIASALGGEAAFALDGPLLPVPSWKVICEVYNEPLLNDIINQAIKLANRELSERDVQFSLESSLEGEHTLYSLQLSSLEMKVWYAYLDGYLILASNKTILINTIQNYQLGNSIINTAKFSGLLPGDSNLHFSFLGYENLSAAVVPYLEKFMAGQKEMTQEQVSKIRQLGSNSSASIAYAYAAEDSIVFKTNSWHNSVLSDLNPLIIMSTFKGFQQLFHQKVRAELKAVESNLTEIGAHLEKYRQEYGHYPSSLATLDLPVGVTRDPFTRGDRSADQIHYIKSPEATEWTLYCVGPDQDDDGGKVAYTTAKGLFSNGDIILTSK